VTKLKLKEWKDKNGNTINISSLTGSTKVSSSKSSKTNKDKFKELIDYMEQHKVASTVKTETEYLFDTGFKYSITHKSGVKEYTITLEVGYSPGKDTWVFGVYLNGDYLDDAKGKGWEELLQSLRSSEFGVYSLIPAQGSKAFKGLTEWISVKDGKKVSITSSTSSSPAANTSTKNYPDQTDRYKKLLAQIDADGFCKYTINLLDDRILAFTLNNGVGVKIIFKPYVPGYLVQIDGADTVCADYEDVLKLLIIEGIIGDTDLCESASFADDFKTYENLWD
jgi:hypothetical protein